uniref:tRNA (cytidine/uridine-2'-O-)-methyltransferase TrmJ n=1 Tax=Acidobacterium capsulatum TaxID=33075 RepID=A0A7V4XTF2_9BACT
MNLPQASPAMAVVLVRTRNPLNIGAAARAMINFGFHDLRVVEPFDLAWQEARSAVGAGSILASARECSTLAEALADCTCVLGTSAIGDRQPLQPIIDLPAALPWLAQRVPGRMALVFGQEKHGLTNDDLSHCDAILRIPTLPEQASMNLGQAVAVCLYEFARSGHAPMHMDAAKTASAADLERLTASLHRLLCISGYIKPIASQGALIEARALIHRLALGREDTHLLTGMLAKIERKLRH